MVEPVSGGMTGGQDYTRQRDAQRGMPALDWLAAQSARKRGHPHGQKRQPTKASPRYGDVLEISVKGLWDLTQQRMEALPLDLNQDAWAAEMDKLNDVFAALHKLEAAGVETIRPNTGEGLMEATTRVAATLPEPKVDAAAGLASLRKMTASGVRHEAGIDTLRQQFWEDLSVALTALGEQTPDTPMKPGPAPEPEQPLTYEHMVRPKKKQLPARTGEAASAGTGTGGGFGNLHGDLPTKMRQMMAMKAYGAVQGDKPSPFAQPKVTAEPGQLLGQPDLTEDDRIYWEKCKRRLFEGLYALRLLRENGVSKVTLPQGASMVDAAKAALKAHGINGVDYDPEKHLPSTPGL